MAEQVQDVDAVGDDGRQVAEQGVDLGRLGLDAVEGQEGFAFPGLQRNAVGELKAAERASVLLQVEVAGGEAARQTSMTWAT